MQSKRRTKRSLLIGSGLLLLSSLAMSAAAVLGPLDTTSADFADPTGTQPGTLNTPILSSGSCGFCHGNYDIDEEPLRRWAGSMKANSMRDPVFHAALAIANQDLPQSGELCLKCHAPGGFLAGRTGAGDTSGLFDEDYEGVTCNFCHRRVDPVSDPANPASDAAILAAITVPTEPGNANYIIDPDDLRRGPFDLGAGFPFHAWDQSPFHQESLLCASCHDISNPVFDRVGGATPAPSDTYVMNAENTAHPTNSKFDMFPVERTYSEWLNSDFAAGPVEMGGRFGGNKTAVSSCQDCHMPDTSGEACVQNWTTRSDLPQHDFNGANSWVPLAVHSLDQSGDLYPVSAGTGQPLSIFQDAVDRNISMLQRACDLELSKSGRRLSVKITNQTGHKLPTGYAEGRRMWINVKFFRGNRLVREHGAYDFATADLTENTRVYEIKHGIDAAQAAVTGLPVGESFHFVLNNTIEKDNRIPPRGFTNAGLEAAQAQTVGRTYPDGQNWDVATFRIPAFANRAEVTVYHQTTTKEYIEFLRDNNVTDTTGQVAYDEWVAAGMSTPVEMATDTLRFGNTLFGGF